MKNIFARHYYDASKIIHTAQLEGLELASFSRRFFAFIIDSLALVFTLYFLGVLLDYFGIIDFSLSVGVSEGDSAVSTENLSYTGPDYLATILKMLIPVFFFGIISYLTNGYTLGKRILKIRIVATSHARLSLWHAIERSLGYYASSLEFGFGFLQYFIDYNRRTVHDRIAETIVIRVKKRKKMTNISLQDNAQKEFGNNN